jgi:predicted RNase H-like HicB family nuclease
MTMKYAVVIERSESGFGAFVPDLPGCVAVGETEDEVRELIREAVELHLEAMREDGLTTPEPSSVVEYIEVSPAA